MKHIDPASQARSAPATLDATPTTGDDPRVVAALEDFLARLDAGERPSRAEWLAQHANIAGALAECLDGLLFVHSAARHLDDLGPAAGVEARFPASTRLGDFLIVREVGRGGMGVVYEAEQVSLRRRVALKVLPAAASLDARQHQRFQVEAQAAAHLHHPHIVPVFGVGCDGEVPYYAMQFIEGRTLAELIRGLQQAADFPNHAIVPGERKEAAAGLGFNPEGTAEPTSPLHTSGNFFRVVARLGVEAAEALEHAHGLGVLHRDVKPSNLMIDRRGHLWVTDFGLARFEGEGGLTLTGDMLGTLRYMSPEQAQARRKVVDQRTDVYSLGATLYELATLRPAFDGRDRHEILNRISLEEPPPPRKVNPSIPRDLETVTLKAMAKEVGARYTTARDLADDLKRFLEDRPVQARRPTWLDRASKGLRRHRTAVAAAAVTLLLGLVVGTTLLWRERRETLQALDGLRDARRRERAGMTLFFATTDSIAMNAMGQLAAHPPSEGDPVWFYKEALASYERVAQIYQDDREMRAVAAEAFRRVGFVRMIMRHVHKHSDFLQIDADGPYQKALALCASLVAESPKDPEPRRLRVSILSEYADMLVRLGRVWEAVTRYREAVAAEDRLASAFPDHHDPVSQSFELRTRLARLFSMTGQSREAEATFREVLRLEPENPEALNNLAWFLVVDPAPTPAASAESVKLAKRATTLESRNAAYWNTLGLALHRAGDAGAAEEAVKKSMELHPPDIGDWLILSLIHARRGEPAKARARLDEVAASVQRNGYADPDLERLHREATDLLDVQTRRTPKGNGGR